MKSWGYLAIRITSSGVGVESTDPDVLDQVAAVATKYVSSCQSTVQERLPSGEAYTVSIKGLQKQDFAIGHLILKQLCLNGWELITVGRLRGSDGTSFGPEYHLKLEIPSQQRHRDSTQD